MSCVTQKFRPALFIRPPEFEPRDLGGAVGKLTTLSSPAELMVLILAFHMSGHGSIPRGSTAKENWGVLFSKACVSSLEDEECRSITAVTPT